MIYHQRQGRARARPLTRCVQRTRTFKAVRAACSSVSWPPLVAFTVLHRNENMCRTSRCRRGGFLYEPANPPRKIIVSDASGPPANCLRRIAVHITKPAGQKKNRQEPAKSRVANNAPPPLSSTAPSVFPGAHARPPAALALAVTLQPFSSASKVSSPARTSFLFPQGECWICSSGSHECDWFMVEFLISKSSVSLLARCARLLLVASRRDSN